MDAYDGIVLVNLIMILSIFFIKIDRLIKRGIKVNNLGYKKIGIQWIVEKMILPLSVLMVYEVILQLLDLPYHVFGQEKVRFGSYLASLKSFGAMVLFLSTVMLFFTLRSFGHSYRLGVDKDNPGKLIDHGIFGFSRNPVYLGLDGVFLGIFIIYSTIFFFSMMIGAAVAMHFMILKEEQALRKLYSEQYINYMKRVPRYLSLKSFRRG